MRQKDCIFLHLAVYRKHFRCKKPNPLRVEHKILREKLKREEATTIFTPFAFQWRDVPSKGTMSTRKCFYSHRVCVSLHWRASTCKSQGGERIVGVGWGGVRGRKGRWENSPSVVIFLPRRPSTVTIEGGQLHDWSFLF